MYDDRRTSQGAAKAKQGQVGCRKVLSVLPLEWNQDVRHPITILPSLAWSSSRLGVHLGSARPRGHFRGDDMKKCSKCGKTKDETHFVRDKYTKDGFTYNCKACRKAYSDRPEVKERERRASKAWRESEHGKAVTKANRKIYYAKPDVKKRLAESRAKYRRLPHVKASMQRWINSPAGVKYRREYQKKYQMECRKDPSYRLRWGVSRSVRKRLAEMGTSKKGQSTFDHLPYTAEELRDHLESLWEPWMSWENYGRGKDKWVIDHIIPQIAFHYESLDDPAFAASWALSNLRPLSNTKNCQKKHRLVLTPLKEKGK